MWKCSFNLCRNQWPIRLLCPCLNVLVLRFVGGWRLLTLEKWIIDLAMVINLFKINHKSVCAWETESAKRWHVISQGQWGGALRRNLHRPHFTRCFSPRPYKCQMARLVNEMNMSQGVLHLNRWEQRTLHILSSESLTEAAEGVWNFLKFSSMFSLLSHEIWPPSPLRACAHLLVQPVSLPSCNACGGQRTAGRLVPSPGL